MKRGTEVKMRGDEGEEEGVRMIKTRNQKGVENERE